MILADREILAQIGSKYQGQKGPYRLPGYGWIFKR
jgi:hypothetical protein